MLIERPPYLYRLLYRRALWRAARRYDGTAPMVYLTFDDGPTPEATPGILDILDRHGIAAVFFMVADNAARYPGLLDNVRKAGHTIANHTMHHLRGLFTPRPAYTDDIRAAEAVLGKTTMFRPPHGLMRRSQYRFLKQHFRIVMMDVVSRDYDPSMSPDDIVRIVLDNARPGSIISFHDSEKSAHNILGSLERIIAGLKDRGYTFGLLTPDD